MNITINLVEETCVACGTHYAVDSHLHSQFKSYGSTFYCPNGHGQSYTETEVMRLKRENDNLQKRTQWAETAAENARREKTALKGQLTKTRNRIANGVCPCCHRTFKQLEAHMSNKHPDFKKAVA